MCLAVPGRIVAGDEPILRVGRVDFGGVVREIALGFVPEAAVGDYVLAHVGVAIAVIDAAEAARMLADLGVADAPPGTAATP
jgi:hydrogenase expression/formation protein HypC